MSRSPIVSLVLLVPLVLSSAAQLADGQEISAERETYTIALPPEETGVFQVSVNAPTTVRMGDSFQYEITVKNVSENVMLKNVRVAQMNKPGLKIESSKGGKRLTPPMRSGSQASGKNQAPPPQPEPASPQQSERQQGEQNKQQDKQANKQARQQLAQAKQQLEQAEQQLEQAKQQNQAEQQEQAQQARDQAQQEVERAEKELQQATEQQQQFAQANPGATRPRGHAHAYFKNFSRIFLQCATPFAIVYGRIYFASSLET